MTLLRASAFRASARATAVAALLASPLHAQAALPHHAAVAAAERAFARMAVDSGQWAAFHEFLDTASVIFRPRATNGKTWYATHRPPSPKAGGELFWTPAFVGASASGDLGFSTGPFRLVGVRPGTSDTVRVGGSFASVWGRRPGEPWRVLVDLGVSDTAVRVVDPAAAPAVARVGARTGGAAAEVRATVLRADSLLGAHYASPSSPDGLANVVAADAWVLRDGGLGPRTGVAAVAATATAAGDGYRSAPLGGAVATAGDLAYTYGSYTRPAAGSTPAQAGNYLRVWRRDGSRWRIVLDVASPVAGQ